MSYSVTIYIANIAAPTNHEDGTPDGHSITGHMWFSLNDDSMGAKYCYGFHPDGDLEMHSVIGRVKTTDNTTYPSPFFTTTFQISDEEYENLMRYCESTKNNHTFGPYYGLGNSCVNYTMNVMNSIRYGSYCDYPSPIPQFNVIVLEQATRQYNSTLKMEEYLKAKREAEQKEKEQARESFPLRQQYETQRLPF